MPDGDFDEERFFGFTGRTLIIPPPKYAHEYSPGDIRFVDLKGATSSMNKNAIDQATEFLKRYVANFSVGRNEVRLLAFWDKDVGFWTVHTDPAAGHQTYLPYVWVGTLNDGAGGSAERIDTPVSIDKLLVGRD